MLSTMDGRAPIDSLPTQPIPAAGECRRLTCGSSMPRLQNSQRIANLGTQPGANSRTTRCLPFLRRLKPGLRGSCPRARRSCLSASKREHVNRALMAHSCPNTNLARRGSQVRSRWAGNCGRAASPRWVFYPCAGDIRQKVDSLARYTPLRQPAPRRYAPGKIGKSRPVGHGQYALALLPRWAWSWPTPSHPNASGNLPTTFRVRSFVLAAVKIVPSFLTALTTPSSRLAPCRRRSCGTTHRAQPVDRRCGLHRLDPRGRASPDAGPVRP